MFFNSKGFTVRTFDSAAYYVLILSPIPPDNDYNIQEFYKNGKIKLIGKGDASANSMKTGSVLLDGECISYFQDGKKSSVCHYSRGYKEGIEEMYYPDGSLYCKVKHTINEQFRIGGEDIYLDCYDLKGTKICDAGNGKWLTYDDSCRYVLQAGEIKKGYKEGDWSGKVFTPDTIRYVYRYRRSVIESSLGYDKKGKSYPFGNVFEQATYRNGPLVFLEVLRNRIKLPNDTNGKKMSIDTMHISFIVERDGKLSQFGVSGNADPQLKEAIFSALKKSNEWTPSKVYGIPFRTRVILPLSEVSGWNTKYKKFESYQKQILYREEIVKD